MNRLKTVRRKTTVWERILNSLDLSRETAPALGILMAGFFVVIFLLVLTDGDMLASVSALILVGIVVLTFYRIDFSFYLFIFAIILFEQFEILKFNPLTFRIQFFKNIESISYLPSFNAGVLNPLEFEISLFLLVWLLIIAVNKKTKINPIPVWFAFITFLGFLTASVTYGLLRGGDFLVSLWEVRSLFYLGLMYLIVPQIIQTKKQLRILIWVILIAITIKALQGLGWFVLQGFNTEGFAALTSLSDTVFMVTIFYLLAALLLFNVKSGERIYIIAVLFILLPGFYMGQHSVAFASLGIAGFVFFVLMENKYRWRLIKILSPLLILGGIYLGVFRNNNSKLTHPVQLVKSGITEVEKYQNPADYYSKLYDDTENNNFAVITRQNMITGIGFGRKYNPPLTPAKITIPIREFIAHNGNLWLLVKTGIFGFFAFWFFFNAFVFKGTFVYKNLKDPYLKAVLAVVIIAVINQMVVSYFDLQLTNYRNMVYLGALMGLLPAIEDMDKYEPPEDKFKDEDGLMELEH